MPERNGIVMVNGDIIYEAPANQLKFIEQTDGTICECDDEDYPEGNAIFHVTPGETFRGVRG